MQKIFLFLLTFFLTATSVCFAAPAKNPGEPTLLKKGFFIPENYPVSARVSYEGSFISNARLKQTQEGTGRVDNFEVFTNLGLVVFSIADRFDLYGGFGASTFESNWRFTNSVGGISRVSTLSNNRYSWTYGVNTTIYQWERAFLGGGIRYSGAHAGLSWITINGANVPSNNAEFRWLQWQAEMAIGCKIGLFAPYLGAKYSNARVRLASLDVAIAGDGEGKIHMENRDHVGVYLGVTLSKDAYFMMTVEGRIIDEEAVSVSGDIRF